MAVSKPKGQSGIETPTSEPGFSLTDMYDSENEEEIDDYFFKHQRRLSDPSSNINNFSKGYVLILISNWTQWNLFIIFAVPGVLKIQLMTGPRLGPKMKGLIGEFWEYSLKTVRITLKL